MQLGRMPRWIRLLRDTTNCTQAWTPEKETTKQTMLSDTGTFHDQPGLVRPVPFPTPKRWKRLSFSGSLRSCVWSTSLRDMGVTAKFSSGVVCTDVPCCPEFKRNENNSLALSLVFFFLKKTNANVAVTRINSFSQRPYRGGGNYFGGQNDSDYMNKSFCDQFVRNTTVQDAPGGAENTRCNTDK